MTTLETLFAALCLAPAVLFAQTAEVPLEGRLKKIADSKSIAIAYRSDALPFSFEDAEKKPTGYMVDLCRSVVASMIERQLGVAPLQVRWVSVTVQNRYAAVAGGQTDMECGATSVTLGSMKAVSDEVEPVKGRDEGLAQFEAGAIDGFAGDRVLLVGLMSRAKDAKAFAPLGEEGS